MTQIPQFLLQGQNPSQAVLEGLQAGAQFNQTREQTGLVQQKRAAALEAQQDLLNHSKIKDRTAEQTSEFLMRRPEYAEDFKRNFDMLNAAQQKSNLSKLTNVYTALLTGDNETAKRLFEKEREGALNAGLDEEAKKAEAMLKNIEIDPKAALVSSEIGLAAVMGAEKFAALKKAIGKGEDWRPLSIEEKKKYGINPKEFWQMSPEGKFEPGKKGALVEINNIKLPKDHTWVDENDKSKGFKVIPGSETARNIEAGEKAEILKKKKNLNEGEIFIEESEKLIKLIKDAPWYSPVAGAKAQQFLPKLRQNAVDAQAITDSLMGRLGFSELQAMRDASKTGGALGAISAPELKFLQSAKRSLSLSQSEDQLVLNLRQFNKDFNKVVHGDPYAPYREDPILISLEQKIGKSLSEADMDQLIEDGEINAFK